MNPELREWLKVSWQDWLRNDLTPVRGPRWMPWLWTVLFAALMAVVFTAIGFGLFAPTGAQVHPGRLGLWLGRNFIVCLTVAVTIHLMFDAARWLLRGTDLRRWAPWQRSALFIGIPLLGVALAWPLGLQLAGMQPLAWLNSEHGWRWVAAALAASLGVSGLLHLWSSAKSRQIEAERQAREAELRLLQAQLEPHFLFNTLAGVISLIDDEPATARRVLQAFTDYLRSSLGALRQQEAPLQQEIELVTQYLTLMQARMEDRLRFDIQVEPGCAALPLPPLLLQPLVENAVLHGLEPSLDGGQVRVQVLRRDGRLLLRVSDDGIGLEASGSTARRAGHGLALQNLRSRLHTRYGPQARVSLEPLAPRGTCVTVELPWPSAAAPPALQAPATCEVETTRKSAMAKEAP